MGKIIHLTAKLTHNTLSLMGYAGMKKAGRLKFLPGRWIVRISYPVLPTMAHANGMLVLEYCGGPDIDPTLSRSKKCQKKYRSSDYLQRRVIM